MTVRSVHTVPCGPNALQAYEWSSSSSCTGHNPMLPPQHTLLGISAPMQAIYADIELAARTNAKVLLTGETGVGKEAVARAIHERSDRKAKPFVTVNCAGVPDSLMESEFFGHVRGSFTGAVRDSPGLLRQAHTGTALLDEVGDMSMRMQALLLRFLETGEIQAVGAGAACAHANVRVITATNRDLPASVATHEFREDLYYRLCVIHVRIPPLRERRADIPILIEHFARLFAQQHQREAPALSNAALDLLVGYHWPGNIRELRNVVERLVLRVDVPTIELVHLPAEITASEPDSGPAIVPGSGLSHRVRVEGILERMLVKKESFWTAVYPLFMLRDITRDDLRFIIHSGLEQTHGSYRMILGLFNMNPEDYKRFMAFLRHHDCHLPFRRFRVVNGSEVDPSPLVGV